MTIRLFVEGVPNPQGSKSAFVRGGRAVIVDGTGKGIARHKAWRALVTKTAENYKEENEIEMLDGPVTVNLDFYMPKPKSKPRWKRWADTKPDLDKLIRSVLDSITGNLIVNDSRVVVIKAAKHYAIEGPTGVEIVVYPVPEDKSWTKDATLFD